MMTSNEDYLWEFLNENDDIVIIDSFVKANSVINNPSYENIMCSISGGSDSDVVLDLISKVDINKKVKYVWFNTGLEYQATKDHLKYLEEKYNIEIIRERAIKPIPLSCKQYGEPFLSKYVSTMIYRLQKHNFKWEDKPFEELINLYPNCISAINWWCDKYPFTSLGTPSRFNISNNKYLKEFLIKNPPYFNISSKCCEYAKKKIVKNFHKNNQIDLNIYGVRKAEGGIRACAYKTCFSINENNTDDYRPIFWYKNETKNEYERKFNIKHSDCYTKYGFKRTGCCCPYGNELEDELKATELYEPLLYKAVNNVFKNSYEYTKKYRDFVKQKKIENDDKQIKGQMNIYDFIGDEI